MYRMENGTLRMGILKTKGLRPLVQNRFPFATKTFWNSTASKGRRCQAEEVAGPDQEGRRRDRKAYCRYEVSILFLHPILLPRATRVFGSCKICAPTFEKAASFLEKQRRDQVKERKRRHCCSHLPELDVSCTTAEGDQKHGAHFGQIAESRQDANEHQRNPPDPMVKLRINVGLCPRTRHVCKQWCMRVAPRN
jgi:hypothetical protein